LPQDGGQEDTTMTRRRHTPDQIIRKLAEGNKLLAGGAELDEVAATSRSPSRRGIAGSRNTAA